ncbi:response regulator [Haliangium ochraceum]|uniref:Two component transcriptional regulator, LuxR family n=1 Tax=Haliangium ochraceum (strain DSM 14365 / JCM 11303 / SMP-2) TaxID=502025 RepID=D0LYS4_HALO1|nr:response regulator transcription factor [Haliangium ochraceum]ACY14394.1 two component transcriptional regulator, LuxR family [Haliangium ochraceum DSM 14365]
MIKIAIADDHALLREGMRRMLSQSELIEVVGEASNGAEAVEVVKEKAPDVLLLDITMPVKDGIEATADILALNVNTKILILSMHADEQYALRTLRAGANGFISKGARLEELLKAITDVHEGQRYLPDKIATSFAERHIRPDAEKPLVETLSKREFQVMTHLAQGMTNREIAGVLQISVKTVDTHRSHVLKKLELRNNSDITRFAIQHGYIQF